MNIGIVCYASVGGSGIVATELAKRLAIHGHDVHLISGETPFRLADYQAGLTFHRVRTPAYPLFREPQYLLSLATRIVQLAREQALDIVHAHYAVPHATAAYLAKQVLASQAGIRSPKIIATLHGTDITLVGSDPSYAETVAFSIEKSDGVTAVSQSLRNETYRALSVEREIRVIPNFLDCTVYRHAPVPEVRARLCRGTQCDKLVTHVSNFRPVKRVEVVIEVFRRIHEQIRSRLLLVGDGPDLERAMRAARDAGLEGAVESVGEQEHVVPLLSVSDLFLLPSDQESFGLAALEAMACEVPVVASRVGGLLEVIEHGVTGFLHDRDDIEGMTQSGLALLTDDDLRRRVAAAGRQTVQNRFCADLVVPAYEAFYEEVLGG